MATPGNAFPWGIAGFVKYLGIGGQFYAALSSSTATSNVVLGNATYSRTIVASVANVSIARIPNYIQDQVASVTLTPPISMTVSGSTLTATVPNVDFNAPVTGMLNLSASASTSQAVVILGHSGCSYNGVVTASYKVTDTWVSSASPAGDFAASSTMGVANLISGLASGFVTASSSASGETYTGTGYAFSFTGTGFSSAMYNASSYLALAGIDITGTSWWSNFFGGIFANNLISPYHVLYANHVIGAEPNGYSAIWVTKTNALWTGTVVRSARLANASGVLTDICISTLSAAAASGLTPFQIMPPGYASNYVPGVGGLTIPAIQLLRSAVIGRMEITLNQNYSGPSNAFGVGGAPGSGSTFSSYYDLGPITGDSSSPVFAYNPATNSLGLIGCQWTGANISYIPDCTAAIQAYLDADYAANLTPVHYHLGSGTNTSTDVYLPYSDLSSFTNYNV